MEILQKGFIVVPALKMSTGYKSRKALGSRYIFRGAE